MTRRDLGTADLIDLHQTPAVLDALYRYASPDSYCALRVFPHERGQSPPWAADVKAGDLSTLIEAIARGARYAATSTTPTVFCPATGCTFRHPGTAKTRDIAEGLALAVELDDGDTAAVLARLEALIGPPTLVVLSGSLWADPETGELHPKRHAYWRLTEAARDEADLTLLYAARRNAALLTGADPTGAALAHCYRWPGSLNRKRPDHPVLCTVDRISPNAEIHLIEAVELLADAVEGAGLNGTGHKGNGAYQGRRELQADPALVAAAMATIPNPDAHYNEWVRVAYAVAGATGGTGYDILLNWSAKSSKHDDGETEALWGRVLSAGVSRIGAGSIFHEAKQHGWINPRRKRPDAPEEPSSDTEPESDAWNTNIAADGETEPVGGDLDALPDLRILKSDLPMVSQKLRDHLAIHPRLFERGGPARLVSFPSEQDRQAEVHQLGGDAVVHAAHEVCRPYQIDARGKRNNVTLPERVAKLYLALNGRWHLRPLHGICGSVLLDNDGGIHSHEGYHAPSGMWCTRTPPLNVPDQPFKDQAVDALYRLRAAMRTFTFKGSLLTRIDGIDADVVDIERPPGLCESAALSGLFTAVCRASLPLAPGVMINAPSVSGSGAGKGLLARMIVAIAFGIIAKAGTAGHDAQELEKRIGASLLRGEPVLLLDNLNNTLLRSAQLESCLTEPLVSVRLFGVLKMQDVRCTALVVVTGNGVQASGDTARRFIYPTLEPPVDNPEQRQYPAGFLDGILARRGELLSDCLTVWRWGRQQSNLKRGLPFGSYERWAAWVRDPLLALGCDDPVKGVQDARDRDPHRVNITALFAEWRFRHGGDWQKADELHPAVRRMVDEKERVPAIRQKLSQMANTRLGGFRLECTVEGNAANRVSLYRVIEIESN